MRTFDYLRRTPRRALRSVVLSVLLSVVMALGSSSWPPEVSVAQTAGTLHFVGNEEGAYAATTALGFDVHDTGMVASAVDALPVGTRALVWTGTAECPTSLSAAFTSFVDANAADSRIFGYYLVDEPSSTEQACVEGVRAMADYIHAHSSFQKAFLVLTDYPGTYAAYSPANSHVDLVGLDPYPCRWDNPARCDLTMIPTEVAKAQAAGVPQSAIVPVYQAFGDEATWRAPTSEELQGILATWEAAVPDPVLDYTYSWGCQASLSECLSQRSDWQDVLGTFFHGPVTLMGAGDIAESGTSTMANATATGDLIRSANPDAVFTLGDNAYPDGSPSDFSTKYDPTWGSFRAKTHPSPGNHEYHSDPPTGYLGYFGTAGVTNSADGGVYYAWDVGNDWRAYSVNTEVDTSGAQLTWLQNDLAAHPGMHYILYTHRPRYTSGDVHSSSTAICPLWDAAAATGGLEIVLAGHQHQYERFAKMDCAGNLSASGARSFVVGSGGNQLYGFDTPLPGSQFRNGSDYGDLRLDLSPTSYTWSFIASGRGWNGSTSVDTNNAGQVLDTGTELTNNVPAPGNRPPSVNAGPDQDVMLPAPAALDGTVTDDGLPNPPGAVTTTWSQLSGPGTATFTNPSAVDTTATFTDPGTYLLQLSAYDGALAASDTVSVTVHDATGGGTAEVRVSAGSDDAEQAVSGSMYLTSSDLELTTDGTTQQVVGVRFAHVVVPGGASITHAYVQFQVDEPSTGPSSMTVTAEAADNAASYTSTSGNITARPTTGSVAWSPPDWATVGTAGPDQRTPDLAALVQAVVNRPGWAPGNALAVQFSGTGTRTAESFEGSPGGAPLLHIDYRTDGVTNTAPHVDAGPDQTITSPATVTLDGTVTDDGLPDPPGAVSTTWTQDSGPAPVTFADDTAVDTTASFAVPGTYVLRLTADDGETMAWDTMTVTVRPAGEGATTIEKRVAAGSDDAEQALRGTMYLHNSDLELTTDGKTAQIVGIRFTGVQIPRGATVTNAYLQFQVDEVSTGTSSIRIAVEDSDDAATYTRTKNDITSRAVSGAVSWSPPNWTTVAAAGPDQRTPDIASLVQAVVDRPGWAIGNAIAVQFSGTGRRTAEAYDGSSASAALLHVEYTAATTMGR